MHKPLKQVKEFHERFELPIPAKPGDISERMRKLRVSVLEEEVQEAVEAMRNEPLENIAKELADVIYVAYGTVLSYGLQEKFEEIFDEVHRSNMSKLDKDGRVVRRADGKVLKSDQYKPADIKSILNQ